MDVHAFDLKKTMDMNPDFLSGEHEHEHDKTISSVGVVEKRPLDIDSFMVWIRKLLADEDKDIYRIKGVLNIADAPERYMFQGVHLIFSGKFDEVWKDDEERESKFIFIGKNLDHEELLAGFAACVETPELIEQKKSELRFNVGDQVMCRASTSDRWYPGTVKSQLYREENFPSVVKVPY